MRLIDADKLEAAIQGTASDVAMNAPYEPEWFTRLAQRQVEILDIVDEMPTVDAVPVVRCKDCRFWSDGVAGCTDHVKVCKIGFYMIHENGYCVHGERKHNG